MKLCKLCEASCVNRHFNNVGPDHEGPLAIFMDQPNARSYKVLGWLLAKCSLMPQDVTIDYIIRCGNSSKGKKPTDRKPARLEITKLCNMAHPRPGLERKAIVAAGKWAIEALIDRPMKEVAGIKDVESGVWAMYSPLYHIMNAGECYRSYRVLFAAAVEAGLKPQYNPDVEILDFAMK